VQFIEVGQRAFPGSVFPFFVGPLFLAKVPGLFDPFATESLLRPKLIVSATADAQVGRVVRTAESFGVRVIELEKRARFATSTVFGDVRTLKTISFEHLASRCVRDAGKPVLPATSRLSRACRSGEALSLEVGK
jgi:hypothetical protein